MKKICCDICGHETVGEDYVAMCFFSNDPENMNKDLCPSCYERVKRFVRNLSYKMGKTEE